MSMENWTDEVGDDVRELELQAAAVEETLVHSARCPDEEDGSSADEEEEESASQMRFNWRPRRDLSAEAEAAGGEDSGDEGEGGGADDNNPSWRIRTNRREISPNGTVLSPALTAAYVARDDARRSHRAAQGEAADLRRQLEDLNRRLDDAVGNEARALAERRTAEAAIVGAELAEPGVWNDTYRRLLAWRDEHGEEAWDGDGVLRVKPSDDRKLSGWLNRCRADYQKDVTETSSLKKRPYRIAALERLGFVWTLPEDYNDLRWDRRYRELAAIRAEHGHVRVPTGQQTSTLHTWVKKQRAQYWRLQNGKPSKMTPERVRRLDELQMQWIFQVGREGLTTNATDWSAMHRELVEWKRTHTSGENLADNTEPEYMDLEAFADHQASLFRKWKSGKTKPRDKEKLRLLEEVDILSIHRGTKADRLEEKLQQLVEYKRNHGNLRCTEISKANPELGLWMEHQRQRGVSGDMKEDQKRRVEEISFSWVPPSKQARLMSLGSSDQIRDRAVGSGLKSLKPFDYIEYPTNDGPWHCRTWENPQRHSVQGNVVSEEGKSVVAKATVVNVDAEEGKAILYLKFDGQIVPAVADSDILPGSLVTAFARKNQESSPERETLAVEKDNEGICNYPVLRNGVEAQLLLGSVFKNRVCDQVMLDSLMEGRVTKEQKASRMVSVLCHNVSRGRMLSPTRKDFVAILKKPGGELHLSRGSTDDAKTILRLAIEAREMSRHQFRAVKKALSLLENSIDKEPTEYEVALQLCLGGQECTLSHVGRFFPCKLQKGSFSALSPCLCDVAFQIENAAVPAFVRKTVRTCRDRTHKMAEKKKETNAASSLMTMREEKIPSALATALVQTPTSEEILSEE